MGYTRGRYSWLLRPALIVYDILIINVFAYLFLNFNEEKLYFFSIELLNDKYLLFSFYSAVFWLILAYLLKFYKVYRYTSIISIFSLLIRQFLAYMVIVYAFVGVFRSISLSAFITLKYLIFCFIAIGFLKIVSFYVLKAIRSYLKGNLRNIVVIGEGENTTEFLNFISKKNELGYNLKGVFGNSGDRNLDGTIEDSFLFLNNNKIIDEIYCAIDDLKEEEINEYVKYTNLHQCNIKFIPNTRKLITKRLDTVFYDYLPILSIEEVTLNKEYNKIIKRSFDVLFALIIIICVLSWLSVILFVLIKIESKGPLFFRHKRNGIDYKEFDCYKYRTLKINNLDPENKYVTQNDTRVTKIGKLLRRTSIDELPQFINVLLGDMSVVGPRPHMLSYTRDYSKVIDKYNFIYRHSVKPGLTGLAQISGFRGEVKNDKDIINRVKYDIFYIENWSILLDIKIIVQTLITIFKGDEKAY